MQDAAGSAFDASSNYGRMMGPIVGLVAQANFGKHTVRGYLGQSVVFGTAESLVIPPGVVPSADGNEVFLENTIVNFGLGVAVKFRI